MIVWRLVQADPTIASTRYRAALPALHLHELGYVSRFSTREEALPNLLGVEGLIFVKAFSEQDLTCARTAQRRGIPVILDICDNIFVEGYCAFGAHPDTFREMAAIASLIVTTGSELARVVRNETGDSTPVMIVPDGVETEVDRERIVRVIAEWQLYSPPMRGYFWMRAQMHEHGALLTTARALLRLGTVVKARAGRIPGRPFRFITTCARTIFRSSRLAVRHARNLSQIVARRVREDGPQWVIRGVARRTRLLIDGLKGTATARPVATAPLLVGASERTQSPVRPSNIEGAMAAALCSPDHRNVHVPAGVSKERTLIWFGNHGAPYAQFGLVELARLRPALCEVAERYPIRLIVVSNSEKPFSELIEQFPFSTQYVPWRSGVVEQLFEESEIALLPNSLDAFSVCKSANRATLALHHGVPVVATRTPALEPFAGCVTFDDWVGGIEAYLLDSELAQQHVAAGRAIIEREFSGKRIAAEWGAILRSILAERVSAREQPKTEPS